MYVWVSMVQLVLYLRHYYSVILFFFRRIFPIFYSLFRFRPRWNGSCAGFLSNAEDTQILPLATASELSPRKKRAASFPASPADGIYYWRSSINLRPNNTSTTTKVAGRPAKRWSKPTARCEAKEKQTNSTHSPAFAFCPTLPIFLYKRVQVLLASHRTSPLRSPTVELVCFLLAPVQSVRPSVRPGKVSSSSLIPQAYFLSIWQHPVWVRLKQPCCPDSATKQWKNGVPFCTKQCLYVCGLVSLVLSYCSTIGNQFANTVIVFMHLCLLFATQTSWKHIITMDHPGSPRLSREAHSTD